MQTSLGSQSVHRLETFLFLWIPVQQISGSVVRTAKVATDRAAYVSSPVFLYCLLKERNYLLCRGSTRT